MDDIPKEYLCSAAVGHLSADKCIVIYLGTSFRYCIPDDFRHFSGDDVGYVTF